MMPKIEHKLFFYDGMVYIFYHLNYVWSKGVSIMSRKGKGPWDHIGMSLVGTCQYDPRVPYPFYSLPILMQFREMTGGTLSCCKALVRREVGIK